jgi:predicted transcriptional regulator
MEYIKEALEIVKAQASHRSMTAEEIIAMVQTLSNSLQGITEGSSIEAEIVATAADAKNAIKEKSVTCLECGKAFKIMTKKHLLTHGLSPEEYREKYGYKKGTPLVAKGLARERRKKMTEMKLWERRKKQA